MHLFTEKNHVWIWVDVNRTGKRVLGFAVDDRSEVTGDLLYQQIKNYPVTTYYTD